MRIKINFIPIISLLLYSCLLIVSSSPQEVKLQELKVKIQNEFDWIAYLEMNPDIDIQSWSREGAAEHYFTRGYEESRVFPSIYPNQPSYGHSIEKLMKFVQTLSDKKVPVEKRTLIILHVGTIDPAVYSLKVVINNLRIFNYAVSRDSGPESTNFYWLNINGGKGNMISYLPSDEQWNVAKLEWSASSSDSLMHLRTLNVVKNTLQSNFGSVLFLNSTVRGPMMYRENGEWVEEFRKLLSKEHNVGMAGPSLNCAGVPHVQTHAYIMRTQLIPSLLAEYTAFHRYEDWIQMTRRQQVDVAQFVKKQGWNITALLYKKRLNKLYFDDKCIAVPEAKKDARSMDPTRWCDLKAEELILYKYGGEVTRRADVLCDSTKTYMREELIRLSENEMKSSGLIVPETLRSGPSFDLFKQYDLEIYRDHVAAVERQKNSVVNRKDEEANKVCLLVRTAKLHESQPPSYYGETINSGSIQEIIQSLMRQTDPNWEAFFFLTDEKPFEDGLKRILSGFNDSRLTFVDVPLELRPKYDPVDAAYTPTDYVLRQLTQRKDCRWLSATNADNIYGTEVIERVRSVVSFPEINKRKHLRYQTIPDIVLVPIDSRDFPELGKLNSTNFSVFPNSPQDSKDRNSKHKWEERCISIIIELKLNALAMTVQPRPILGHADLASAFFSRPKLLAENLFFGNFTNTRLYPCKGCQDGYLTEYLVNYRDWTYHRLPLDGLRSTVFHGPSPSWCIASGNVWFDHPDVRKVSCYSQRTVDTMRVNDTGSPYVFDWYFFTWKDRVCLRFSNFGFHQARNSTVY